MRRDSYYETKDNKMDSYNGQWVKEFHYFLEGQVDLNISMLREKDVESKFIDVYNKEWEWKNSFIILGYNQNEVFVKYKHSNVIQDRYKFTYVDNELNLINLKNNNEIKNVTFGDFDNVVEEFLKEAELQ
ncbi:hypothetical protein VO178_19565 [Lysinibacillus fusiformis]|uniref:hypothetical protein n=1 Tax=Lysinibacillus fusiformis TaxID=28031 RepID=UPI002D794231|nr:hypothetical protein [Lysinibacillus fusiformis]WRS97554.1 hypothetical protein VO178_19565 [Lysinibacillus fusiformis]